MNYVGAGTIEFVSDGKDVFFIEMNTRLQVEHPVTELITGIDLVEWQFRVAFGEKLPLAQDQIKLNGHAIEARVYAENPNKNFMPSVGRIKTWRTPPEVDGLRIDAGYREGDAVSPNYDAMLAKIIAWAPTREAAISRLNRGLEETDVRGIVTNIPFLSALVTHAEVRANAIDTGFIERHLKDLTETSAVPGETELAAAVAAILLAESKMVSTDAASPWRTRAGCRSAGASGVSYSVRGRPSTRSHSSMATVRPKSGSGKEILHSRLLRTTGDMMLVARWNAKSCCLVVEGHELYLRTRNGRFDLHWVDPFGGDDEEQVGEDRIVAPLPGTVVALLAEEGAVLEKGAPILTLEVMKMEQTLRAPYAGKLKKIKCKVGDIVQEGVELAEIEPAASMFHDPEFPSDDFSVGSVLGTRHVIRPIRSGSICGRRYTQDLGQRPLNCWLLLPLLSGGIAGIARRFALGLERGLGGHGFFFLPGELCGGGRSGLCLAGISRGLLDLAGLPRLVAGSRLGLAFGLSLLHGGVVGTGLARETCREYFSEPRAPPFGGPRSRVP